MDLQRIEFDAHLGENIEEYAKRAVKHLAERQKKHEDLELYLICTFNDVKVITTKSSTVDSIVSDFHARMDNNGYEYRQTDEYKESVARREKELKELNTKAKYMMKQFDKIVCVSYDIEKSIKEVIGDPGNLIVKYNPIDIFLPQVSARHFPS